MWRVGRVPSWPVADAINVRGKGRVIVLVQIRVLNSARKAERKRTLRQLQRVQLALIRWRCRSLATVVTTGDRRTLLLTANVTESTGALPCKQRRYSSACQTLHSFIITIGTEPFHSTHATLSKTAPSNIICLRLTYGYWALFPQPTKVTRKLALRSVHPLSNDRGGIDKK